MKNRIYSLGLLMYLLIINVVSLQAQKDSICHIIPKSYSGILILNIGIGGSIMESMLAPSSFINISTENNIFNSKAPSLITGVLSEYNFVSQTPVYNSTLDYGISGRVSIGIGISYQRVIGYGYSKQYEDDISRLNAGLRCIYYLHPKKRIGDYLALRSGISMWKDLYKNPDIHTSYPLLTRSNFSLWSIQILYGYRYFFTSSFGLQFELGIGSPYFAEGGLTFRINPHKMKQQSK